MDFATIIGIVMQVVPAALRAIQVIAQDKGKPADQIALDVINHLTPGQPNAPALNG